MMCPLVNDMLMNNHVSKVLKHMDVGNKTDYFVLVTGLVWWQVRMESDSNSDLSSYNVKTIL